MSICDSPFCAVRKDLINHGGGWLWWELTMRSGEVRRVRLLKTWVGMGPAGPFIWVADENDPTAELRLDLVQVVHMRPT
ncbi:MAG: hypothetical protein P9M14_10600 [Candidatus Alcyoniella australis]|nr:hypothetical protein [Candidatus Alcyoniella australis]